MDSLQERLKLSAALDARLAAAAHSLHDHPRLPASGRSTPGLEDAPHSPESGNSGLALYGSSSSPTAGLPRPATSPAAPRGSPPPLPPPAAAQAAPSRRRAAVLASASLRSSSETATATDAPRAASPVPAASGGAQPAAVPAHHQSRRSGIPQPASRIASAPASRSSGDALRSAAAPAGAAVASEDGDEGVDPALPLDVQVRLLRAGLRLTRGELREAQAACTTLRGQLDDAAAAKAAAAAEQTKLSRGVAASEAALVKARAAVAAAEAREAELKQQLAAAQREALEGKRVAKTAESSSTAMDVRLHRLQEENESLRGQLAAERAAAAEAAAGAKAQAEALGAAVKRLERQKAELLAGFKKQMRLIDVLKRQRIHLEAARLLSFTEEEFTRAIGAEGSSGSGAGGSN